MARPRVQFLYIHHTFVDELSALSDLLDYLGDHFAFLSHSEAVDAILKGGIDRPYVSISCDDGFKNNLLAGDMLEKRGISACFFINPAIVGVKDFDIVKAHCAQRLHVGPIEFLDWDDVSRLIAQGHEIGAHTMDHMRISGEQDVRVREDLLQCRTLLLERCGKAKHFSWPYGRYSDFSEAARRIVFDVGFESCSSAERGAHFPGEIPRRESLCIHRDHLILNWPLGHLKYFLRKSARGLGKSCYPYESYRYDSERSLQAG